MPIKRYLEDRIYAATLHRGKLISQKTANRLVMGNVSVTEKPYRSVVKSISWRLIGTFDTMLISFIITGNVKFAVKIGGVELFTKMALYFFHERLWNKIKFGRVQKKEIDYQI